MTFKLAYIGKWLESDQFWAGYHRRAPGRSSRWSDDWLSDTTEEKDRRLEFLQKNWANNEPNNFGSKDQGCAVFWGMNTDKWDRLGNNGGLFDDTYCDAVKPVVCENVEAYKPNYITKGECNDNEGYTIRSYRYYLSGFGTRSFGEDLGTSDSAAFDNAVSLEDLYEDHFNDIMLSHNVKILHHLIVMNST